jgi:tetratricopeptide (TPR) repeat protein
MTKLEYENLISALNMTLVAQASIRGLHDALDRYLLTTHQRHEALTLYRSILDRFEQYSEEKLYGSLGLEYVNLIATLAIWEQKNEQYIALEDRYQKLLQVLKVLRDVDEKTKDLIKATTYHQLGRLAQDQQRFGQAEQYYQQALQIYQKHNDTHEQAKTFANLGIMAEEQQKFEQAEQYYQQALEIFQEYNDPYEQADIYHQLGEIAFQQQEYEQARDCFLRALEMYVSSGDSESSSDVLVSLAQLWQKKADESLPTIIATMLNMTPEEAKSILSTEAQEEDTSVVDNIIEQFTPLLELIAAVANGISSQRSKLEAAIADLETRGWHIREAVQSIWNGERDPTSLTQMLDEQDKALVLRILEILSQPLAARGLTIEKVISSLPLAIRESIERGDALAFEQAVSTLVPKIEPADYIWTILGSVADIADLEGRVEDAKNYRRWRKSFAAIVDNPDKYDYQIWHYSVTVAIAALGKSYMQKRVEAALPLWEETGWSITVPIKRILEGEREWDLLIDGLDIKNALLVLGILDSIAQLSNSTSVQKHSVIWERLKVSLSPIILEAVEQDNFATLEQALEKLTDEQQAKQIWSTLDILAEIAELEGQTAVAQHYHQREREALTVFLSKIHPITKKEEAFIMQKATAARGHPLHLATTKSNLIRLAAEQGPESQAFTDVFLRILEGERDWHVLMEGQDSYTLLIVLKVLETIERLEEVDKSETEQILTAIPPSVFDKLVLSDDPISRADALQSLSAKEMFALEAELGSVGEDSSEKQTGALITGIVAAIRGDTQMQNFIQRFLALAEGEGWQLTTAVKQILAGERNLYHLVEGLDLNNALFIRQVLEALAQPYETQVLMSEQILATLPFALREAAQKGDTAIFEEELGRLSFEELQALQLWKTLSILAVLADMEGRSQAAQHYRSLERLASAAFEQAGQTQISQHLQAPPLFPLPPSIKPRETVQELGRTELVEDDGAKEAQPETFSILSIFHEDTPRPREIEEEIKHPEQELVQLGYAVQGEILKNSTEQIIEGDDDAEKQILESLPPPLRNAALYKDIVAFKQALQMLSYEEQDVLQIWEPMGMLADLAELQGKIEIAQNYRRYERLAFAAFAGNRRQIELVSAPFIFLTAAAARDNMQAREAIKAALPGLEEEGWFVTALIEHIWDGERNWELLAEDLDKEEALLALLILETLAQPIEAKTHLHERLASALSATIGDDIQGNIGIDTFNSIVEAIAIAALGDMKVRGLVEDFLPNLEEKGWDITAAINRVWNGERDWHLLVANMNAFGALLVLEVIRALERLERFRAIKAFGTSLILGAIGTLLVIGAIKILK